MPLLVGTPPSMSLVSLPATGGPSRRAVLVSSPAVRVSEVLANANSGCTPTRMRRGPRTGPGRDHDEQLSTARQGPAGIWASSAVAEQPGRRGALGPCMSGVCACRARAR